MKIINHKDGTVSIETDKTDDEIKAMSDEDLITEAIQIIKTGGDPMTLMMLELELDRRGIQLLMPLIDKDVLDEFEKGLTSIGEMFGSNLGGEDPLDIAKKVRKMAEGK